MKRKEETFPQLLIWLVGELDLNLDWIPEAVCLLFRQIELVRVDPAVGHEKLPSSSWQISAHPGLPHLRLQ